ncbi:MAG: DUF5658 family protein [Candidatus Spechtbacterales bacterium]
MILYIQLFTSTGDRQKMKKLLVLSVFLHMMDYVTTYIGVAKMGAKELNPFVKSMIEKGQWNRVFALKVAAIGQGILMSRTSRGKSYLIVSNALMGAVVASNSIQIAIRFWMDMADRREIREAR